MEEYIVSVWKNDCDLDNNYYQYKIFQINDGYKVEWFHYQSKGEIVSSKENLKEVIENRLQKIGILNNRDKCTIEYEID